MTTTNNFNKKPDYYSSVEECKKANKIKNYTNPRYKEFNQTHFTAGDEDQFQEFISSTNNELFIPDINIKENKFIDINLLPDVWIKNKNLTADCVNNTFRYLFNKFKKGLFIKIQN